MLLVGPSGEELGGGTGVSRRLRCLLALGISLLSVPAFEDQRDFGGPARAALARRPCGG